jgi:copper chaperone CopZ
MEKFTLDLPTMYGDHHVTEVRRIVLALPGVQDIYASSAFHTIEVTYDPAKVSPDDITGKLDEAGYLGELMVPVEESKAVVRGSANGNGTKFRHTATYATAGKAVSFAHDTGSAGRPLWPCPGFGPTKNHMDD